MKRQFSRIAIMSAIVFGPFFFTTTPAPKAGVQLIEAVTQTRWPMPTSMRGPALLELSHTLPLTD